MSKRIETRSAYFPKAILAPREKPLLILIAPPFVALSGFSIIAFAIAMASTAFAAGVSVSEAVLVLAISLVVVSAGAVSVAAAYGLFAERSWARELLTHVPAGLAVLGIAAMAAVGWDDDSWIGVGNSIVMLGLCYWYFFGYAPVVRYYERLSARERSGQG